MRIGLPVSLDTVTTLASCYTASQLQEDPNYSIWVSNSNNCEESYLLGYNAVLSSGSQPKSRRNMSLYFAPAFTLIFRVVYSSILKIEAIYSCKTWVDFQRVTWRHMPENGTLQDSDYSLHISGVFLLRSEYSVSCPLSQKLKMKEKECCLLLHTKRSYKFWPLSFSESRTESEENIFL
jgi:hypothetical protein